MNDTGTIANLNVELTNKNRKRDRESRAHSLLSRIYALGALDNLSGLKNQVEEYFKSTEPLGDFKHNTQYDTRGELVKD